eukprot:TRINITY_DN36346_c0_g1_i1.p1 TRINITY_DN36346_c0_g1~~TRINITY_DN36346_c0_g1_i1.p1  ORF type:complete len:499 (+),score=92.68 TRINITY_DN36346_c0_g1_i1:63-1499(+)
MAAAKRIVAACSLTALVVAVRAGYVSGRMLGRAGAAVGTGVVVLAVVAVRMLQRIYRDVEFEAPTEDMLKEPHSSNAMFRHFPMLWGKLAWRSIGVFPTPLHKCTVTTPGGTTVRFVAKREDLCDPFYAGNKVRTLQYQVACAEVALRRTGGELYVIGAPGSNQCVATAVHGQRCGLRVHALWLAPEAPDRDNALNMLSVLSLGVPYMPVFLKPSLMLQVHKAAYSQKDKVMFFGGNNPTGALGHVSGLLEVADEIVAGRQTDPDAIYLPLGSSCTTCGLCVGIAAARFLGLPAFQKQGFKVHAVAIHQDMSKLNSYGVLRWGLMNHVIRGVCAAIRESGGPDLTEASLAVCRDELVIHNFDGKYGAHTDKSRAARDAMSSSGVVEDGEGQGRPLWLCSTFTSKAFSVMLDHLETGGKDKEVIFWATKSLVQPRGHADAWQRKSELPPRGQRWVDKCGVAEPQDYLSVSTPVDPRGRL